MKIAIPIWNGRVSPVMDTARQLLIVQQDPQQQPSRTVIEIPMMGVSRLARFLADLQIDVLICGAMSQQLEHLLTAAGVKSYAWLHGETDEIIAAHSGGFLHDDNFLLPGCRRRGRGGRRGRGCRRLGRNNQTEEKS